jgi:hypothetical protein
LDRIRHDLAHTRNSATNWQKLMEASMAGLIPERRTRKALERANAELIERHKRHLQSWVSDKAASSEQGGRRVKEGSDQTGLRNSKDQNR